MIYNFIETFGKEPLCHGRNPIHSSRTPTTDATTEKKTVHFVNPVVGIGKGEENRPRYFLLLSSAPLVCIIACDIGRVLGLLGQLYRVPLSTAKYLVESPMNVSPEMKSCWYMDEFGDRFEQPMI
jgi:hypothetical protein